MFVTATARNEIFKAKFVQGLTWHPNMLKVKDLSEIKRQKAEDAPRRTSARDDCIDVYSICRTRYCAHIWEINVAFVAESSVPYACLRIPMVSCVVTSASAGKPRSISIE